MPAKMWRRLVVAALALTILVAVVLALPVAEWRTGRQAAVPLTLKSGDAFTRPASRLWIDSDAACGHSRRTDPDDCIAISLLIGGPVEGIASVFGNETLAVTDPILRALVSQHSPSDRPLVYRGADRPYSTGSTLITPAHAALEGALAREPLTIVALGPLTNIAAVLRERPDLLPRVAALIAVMGRRPGHVFHPTEGAGRAMLLGHGPIFRDLNLEQDPQAAAEIVRMGLPLFLVPYDAARHVELTAVDLERMRARGAAWAWIAERARGWLDFWEADIGRRGFFPFDVIAATFVLRPDLLRCATVSVEVGKDDRLFWPWRERMALLVNPAATPARADGSLAAGSAVYCPEVDTAANAWLVSRVAHAPLR